MANYRWEFLPITTTPVRFVQPLRYGGGRHGWPASSCTSVHIPGEISCRAGVRRLGLPARDIESPSVVPTTEAPLKLTHFATALALVCTAAGCKSSTTPSSTNGSGTSNNSTPTAVVSVSYSPSPVPWTQGPGTNAACATTANLWKFTYTFKESAGTAATITSVTPTTDGTTQPAIALAIAVPANGQTVVAAETCFGTSSQHSWTQVFSGTDAQGRTITFNGALTFAAK